MPIVSTVRGSFGAQGRFGRGRSAIGGTITNVGGYQIHAFTTVGSATFTPSFSGTIEYMIIAGGGAGGAGRHCGAGGAGGYLSGTVSVTAQNYTISVGGGGPVPAVATQAQQGSNTTAFSLTAIGGGYGGGHSGPIEAGGNGGSAGSHGHTIGAGGTRVAGQGNLAGYTPNRGVSGGGGGAGAAGVDGVGSEGTGTATGGAGGAGIANSILGTSYYWAAGGGGSANPTAPVSGSQFAGGNGGIGGGGGGAISDSGAPRGAGTGGGSALNNGSAGAKTSTENACHGGSAGANTGSGGGGAAGWSSQGNGNGGGGGSGIVVIRYQP